MKKVAYRAIQTLAILTAFAASPAAPQTEFVPQSMAACGPEIRQSCAGLRSGGGRIVKCLQSEPAISAACKAAVLPDDGVTPSVSITVTINRVRSKSGFIFVTLSDDPDKFPTGRRTVITPASGDSVQVTFGRLKPNTYAVTAFHDENDNAKFDMTFTGGEGFAASNGVVGQPSFADSSVPVLRDTKIDLSMTYF